MKKLLLPLAGILACLVTGMAKAQPSRPNIVFIYTDDVGYGDVSCYGAVKVSTPNIDRLAEQGLLFTNGHASSATCTPSRYSFLTGRYAWRKKGTGVAPGDASLIIDTGRATVASVLKQAGYTTGVVGKWHLGLGGPDGPDWNGEIRPGPLELGFDESFIIPATLDRVPCVYVENHRIVRLDLQDPITVDYQKPVGDWPTGREHPELLRMQSTHGHDNTIINGIGRIGYMTGGRAALWRDQDVADTLTARAQRFIAMHREQPFFLYFATNDIHVPRDPHERFVGKSGMGPRGDAILQLDWCVGRLLHTLDSLGLTDKTLVIFSSDNGPVLDDGYRDGAIALLSGHRPAGPLSGGKYSAFEAGTRVPFIVRWPGKVKPGRSAALVSQVDLLASLAALTGQKVPAGDAQDSEDISAALLGRTDKGRESLVEQGRAMSLISGNWKYIAPKKGPKILSNVHIASGMSERPQLYNLETDIAEQQNVAAQHPGVVKKMADELKDIMK
ncbi:sulfatase family protein [Chitinophaga japonensis]|uniref:Arylsulfatase A-like enzyme n=1 Tax=Chitinophaga japonensis TaxID=104662 RepID=A0A562T0X9_CHIJA|nr:arylsulfatase [Chitinophaga japonensis]TWI86963.1 arylsulfatase A-like enzyme [Chitinophaga japonensis]